MQHRTSFVVEVAVAFKTGMHVLNFIKVKVLKMN